MNPDENQFVVTKTLFRLCCKEHTETEDNKK